MKQHIFLGLFVAALTACSKVPPVQMPGTNLEEAALIPAPREVTATGKAFPLHAGTSITYDPAYAQSARSLQDFLHQELMLPEQAADSERSVISGIHIRQGHDSLPPHNEAYEIRILGDSLILFAHSPEGSYRGIQTLKQLLPRKSNDTLATYPIWPVPSGTIRDWPRFDYRGTMLDVARHFFTVAEVKRYIELLAYYKINRLHLHLSDDQGWRIAINSWPELARTGGKTEVGGGPGGYYTQEDFKKLIDFAAAHHMMIIPEIDMPGHTNAASVAYPVLNGAPKPARPYFGTRVGFSTLATKKDTVYRFIDDVVREISALSPSPYFHIGGDESHATRKSDYKYFVERVQQIVKAHGKTMVGWDEIANTGIDTTAVVQFWNSEKNAHTAAEKGMKVILSPAKHAYLDMKYDSLSKHGLDWAGHIPLEKAYGWDPGTYLQVPESAILGIEAPLWSETISNSAELEYLAFPRIIAYAELGWSGQEQLNWQGFRERLAAQQEYLEQNNVNYYPSPSIPWRAREVQINN